MSSARCGACERPKHLCECLDRNHMRAQVIDLHKRDDLCLIGWEDYRWATRVATHDVDRTRTIENLVPYENFEAAVADAIYLNSRRIFDGADKKKGAGNG